MKNNMKSWPTVKKRTKIEHCYWAYCILSLYHTGANGHFMTALPVTVKCFTDYTL